MLKRKKALNSAVRKRDATAFLSLTCTAGPGIGVDDDEVSIEDAVVGAVVGAVVVSADISVDHLRKAIRLGEVHAGQFPVDGIPKIEFLISRARRIPPVKELDGECEEGGGAPGRMWTDQTRCDDG